KQGHHCQRPGSTRKGGLLAASRAQAQCPPGKEEREPRPLLRRTSARASVNWSIGLTIFTLLTLLALGSGRTLAQHSGIAIKGSSAPLTGISPQENRGSLLVPLRGYCEQHGARVAWIARTHTAIVHKDQITIVLKIGDLCAHVNGQYTPLEA